MYRENNKKNGTTGEKSKSEHNNPKREQENREKWSRKLRKKKELKRKVGKSVIVGMHQ